MEYFKYDRVNVKLEHLEEKSWKPLLRQSLVCSGALSIYLSIGINYGAPTVIINQMRQDNSTGGVSIAMASWLSSIFGYASLPWIFILTFLTHKFGRKKTFIFIAFVNITSFVLFYLSFTTTHFLLLSIFQGCATATNLTTCLLILTEYTSPKYRGTFLTMKAATFSWGIWISNAIGIFFHWKYIPIFGFICSLYPLTAFFWRESPYWLAINGKFLECDKAHRWLKGTGELAERDLENIKSKRLERFSWNSLKEVRNKQFYKPTLVSCFMILQYYASGKLVCAIYSIEILKQITSSDKATYTAMLILDGVTVLSSYLGCLLNSFVKRRTQFFVTSLIGLLFLFGLSLYLYLIKLEYLQQNNIITIVILVIFSIAVSSGPFIMGSSILGELIPSRYKNLCTIFVSIFYSVLNSNVLKLFPYIHMAFGLHGTFLCYGIAMLIITSILYKLLPETKDRSLQEIEEYFK